MRQLLIAVDDAFREAWRQPQVWDHPGKNRELPMSDGGRALRAGEPVIVSGSEIFGALFHAGQPTEGWCHGEANARKRWLLDARDRLSEWVPEILCALAAAGVPHDRLGGCNP
jgi:hypothetical protein